MKTNQIHIGGRKNVIPENVILLEADENYTKLYLTDGVKIHVATTLKKLEARFAHDSNFFRSNKSYIINLNYLVDYQDDSFEIEMPNNKIILVSRRRKKSFGLKMNLLLT